MAKRDKTPADALPAILIEAEAVDTIVDWIDHFAGRLESEEGRRRLRASIGEKLREGAISRMQVIAAAKDGDQDADLVLRELIVECISRKVDLPTELAEYNQWIVASFPVRHPPGRKLGNTWLRDVGITVLAMQAQRRWPAIPKTRNRHHKRAGVGLSISLLISRALGRRGINLEERGVETVLNSKLEAKLAERLSVFLRPD